MRTSLAIALVTLLAASEQAVRFRQNPIVTPASSPTIGDNINGPSLIRVPSWVERPLGHYYLYFSHHAGKFIRLAYADRLSGPWTVHPPGTLRLEEAPRCYDHVASPDVHVDDARREILMYFHCPSGGSVDSSGRVDINQQQTFLAVSNDGLQFRVAAQPFGPAYFRVFRWGEYYYAIVRAGNEHRVIELGSTVDRPEPVNADKEHSDQSIRLFQRSLHASAQQLPTGQPGARIDVTALAHAFQALAGEP